MKKRIATAVLAGLLILAVILRWPRLDPDQVYVTRSEYSDDEMLVEYRMARPFQVALTHGLEVPPPQLEGSGIQVGGGETLRHEPAGTFGARRDLLRGEYYVRMRFRRGTSLSVEGDGRQVIVAPWSQPDARKAEWESPGANLRLGNGVGVYLAHLKGTTTRHEYLEAKAGTDVQ